MYELVYNSDPRIQKARFYMKKEFKSSLNPVFQENGCSTRGYFVKTLLEICLKPVGNESAFLIAPFIGLAWRHL